MNAPRFRWFCRAPLRLLLALLFVCLVPASIGLADSDVGDPGQGAVDGKRLICPRCCYSECYAGTWLPQFQTCVQGGNGGCMHCDTYCTVLPN